jgi:hypothetical protein
MPLPWVTIITSLPGLIDAASKLFRKAGTSPKIDPSGTESEQVAAIIKRLEYYESLEVEQAKLLQQTVEQLQNVTVSSSAMARRANIATAISIISLIVAASVLLTK